MRRVARFLRKLADLIDPRVGPSEVLTVRIDCDASAFKAAVEGSIEQVERLRAMLHSLRSPARADEPLFPCQHGERVGLCSACNRD